MNRVQPDRVWPCARRGHMLSVSAAGQESGATGTPEAAPWPLGERRTRRRWCEPACRPRGRPRGSSLYRRVPFTRRLSRRGRIGNPTSSSRCRRPPMARAGDRSPSDRAEWIEGYWEWDEGRKELRLGHHVACHHRPVLGQWLLEARRSRLYRVPGFWSERKTDRSIIEGRTTRGTS